MIIPVKHRVKLSTALALIISLALSACKKTESIANKNAADKTNYEELSKQIALNIYNSFNSNTNASIKNSAASIRTNSTYSDYPLNPQCGDVVVFPTRRTVETIGDTTRTTTSNRVYSYLCNNNRQNEYHLADTVTIQKTANLYKSVITAIQNHNTRSIASSDDNPLPLVGPLIYLPPGATITRTYPQPAVTNGQITAGYTQTKYNSSNVTTDNLVWTTRYTLNNVLTRTVVEEGFPYQTYGRRIAGGQATFTASAYHKGNQVDVEGLLQEHTGVITFRAELTPEEKEYVYDYASKHSFLLGQVHSTESIAFAYRVTFVSGGFSSAYDIFIVPIIPWDGVVNIFIPRKL